MKWKLVQLWTHSISKNSENANKKKQYLQSCEIAIPNQTYFKLLYESETYNLRLKLELKF